MFFPDIEGKNGNNTHYNLIYITETTNSTKIFR
jgi:hypothetical protein